MTRIVEDKNGAYDLAHVIEVGIIPQEATSAGGARAPLPPVARLHFDSGVVRSTVLPYAATRDAWLAVKAAEGHPIDHAEGSRTQ
jgi:hypothetical protein